MAKGWRSADINRCSAGHSGFDDAEILDLLQSGEGNKCEFSRVHVAQLSIGIASFVLTPDCHPFVRLLATAVVLYRCSAANL